MPNRHIIKTKDFNGFEKRILMAYSEEEEFGFKKARKLEFYSLWHEYGAYLRYVVTIDDEEHFFLIEDFSKAVEQYNEA